MTNRNPQTGIRYGVISGNSLDPDVLNELFYGSDAVNLSEKEAYEQAKAEFGAEFDDLMEQAEIAASEADHRMSDRDKEEFIAKWFEDNDHIDDREAFIDRAIEHASERWQIEEPTIEGEYEGVSYLISWLGGAPIVYATHGPMTYVRSLCSPCVPGAADLDSGFDPNGYLTYTVPQDWIYEHNDLRLFHAGPDQVVDGPV